jgi:hypothetical protein
MMWGAPSAVQKGIVVVGHLNATSPSKGDGDERAFIITAWERHRVFSLR